MSTVCPDVATECPDASSVSGRVRWMSGRVRCVPGRVHCVPGRVRYVPRRVPCVPRRVHVPKFAQYAAPLHILLATHPAGKKLGVEIEYEYSNIIRIKQSKNYPIFDITLF